MDEENRGRRQSTFRPEGVLLHTGTEELKTAGMSRFLRSLINSDSVVTFNLD